MPSWDDICAARDVELHRDSAEYFARGIEWATAAGWWALADYCLVAAQAHRALVHLDP